VSTNGPVPAIGAERRLGDRSVVRIATTLLFVLGAWPLLVCDVPPLEDLPAHLATAVVIRHPEAYPDLVFHGFFKTNATLFLWLHACGEAHLVLAAKAFVALVVFSLAWVLPRLVLELGGRERVPAATLLAAPLVHNWFVAMGMLDYALASALALVIVLLLVREARDPRRTRMITIAALGLIVWYTHVFALAMLALLAVVEWIRLRLARDPNANTRVLRAFVALAPALALAAWSVVVEFLRGSRAAPGIRYRPPWETVYELWAKYAWAFSKLEIASLVSFVVLGWCLFRARRTHPMLSPFAAIVLLVLALGLPSEAFDWYAVNSRVLPFLYAAALVTAPMHLPRWATASLAACALSISVGLGIDYARLGRDMNELASGISVVPENADLVPVIFEPKGSSENTWALVNAWGLYVVARHTSAPLVFAHSPSFPIGYRAGSSVPRDDPSFAQEHHSPDAWRTFAESLATRGWVLEWGVPPPEMVRIPRHTLVVEHGRLRLYSPAP
jgi:hypothetical protein